MKRWYLLLVILISYNGYSQGNCKVLKIGIDSLYEGSCKKGLADGAGEAWGKHHYKGDFKKGYPHGNGTIEYNDGSVYKGGWKNGEMDGKGFLYFKKEGRDTVITANWRKGKIVEKVLLNTDYKILKEQTPDRLKVYRSGDGNTVHYRIYDYGTSTVSNVLISGTSGIEYNYTTELGYKSVTFPFTARISYETWNALMTQRIRVQVELELIKSGEWTIDIR